tara:strand:+ start:1381 stop:1833 length:453 start_codon:yes stop_codon:yes gene_type:complete
MKNQIKTIETLQKLINNNKIYVSPSVKRDVDGIVHMTSTLKRNEEKYEKLIDSHIKTIEIYKKQVLSGNLKRAKLDDEMREISNLHYNIDRVNMAIHFEANQIQSLFKSVIWECNNLDIDIDEDIMNTYQVDNNIMFSSYEDMKFTNKNQ